MEVVEDFESRPHKAVSLVVERGKEIQEWNEQKLPKVLQVNSRGRLPGRSTKEKGREGRRGRRGWRRRNEQEPNHPRSGCKHPREGKYA